MRGNKSLVPLQSRSGLMFLRRMMGVPNCNVRTCGGIPCKSNTLHILSLSSFIQTCMVSQVDIPTYG
ncbi:hypothetical protein FWK35_00023708 [Aphis craccivora]|uniref:Uncharacterized protein n=1 Tax=Aphis craccivora TaxID=307492 RepID=A0A6G0WYG6_APHCR|nr:hypothetical protein FWK35_00023708 [Aphis craccivora]